MQGSSTWSRMWPAQTNPSMRIAPLTSPLLAISIESDQCRIYERVDKCKPGRTLVGRT